MREAAGRLLRVAKAAGVATVLVGHVTKDGAVAGPRVLEIPQTELSAQPQETGFSFSNMSLGGQIGIFAGIIAVLFIVMRMM